MWIWMTSAAIALTPPQPGAVALPVGAEITLPFPEGTAVAISCGYTPYCSAFHSGTDETCCTNDYYALDLVRDQYGGGHGEPIVAIADGEVVYADWASGGWASFGRIVLIEHDFGDGHTYLTLYAHLLDWSVSVGDVVAAKDEIGLMGGSGNYVDGWFGSHLHFSLYQDASFLGGPYAGHATVPEPIDGYEDLLAGDDLVAGAGPGSAATMITVDDEDPGFLLTGTASEAGSGGYRDHFYYRPSASSPTTTGRWTPDIPETGLYTVSGFVPYSGYATAVDAPFTLHAHGEVAAATQDQSIIGGAFHDLFGRSFKLVAGQAGYLELHDGSGEGSSVYVAFDAARFQRVGDPGTTQAGEPCGSTPECADDLLCAEGICRDPCTTSGCAPGGACDASTGLCDLWPGETSTTDTDTSPPTTGPTDGGGTEDTGGGADTGARSEPEVYSPPKGCSCATGPGGADLGAALGAALIPGWLVLAGAFSGRRRAR